MGHGLGPDAGFDQCAALPQEKVRSHGPDSAVTLGSLPVSRLPEIPDVSALARLFHQERVQEEAVWFSLPGGATLFAAGDISDQLYFLRAGRLGAFRREPGHETQFLGVIRPGEPAGEMSLIAEAPHSADVVALRDCEIIAVPRDIFLEACEADTAVMIELAKLMMLRSRQPVSPVSAT